MKSEKLVVQRFEELDQRATLIASNKKYYFTGDEGVQYFKVSSSDCKAWEISVLNLLQKIFGEDSIHFQQFSIHSKGVHDDESMFQTTRAIFDAAREDYLGGYLFNYKGLIKAEVIDNVLEQATELLEAGYKDLSCVIAGVALETTLKELCTRNTISHGKLDRMNVDLCKVGVYNMGMQKQVTAWAERRNNAAHGDWAAYNKADVDDMIRGVTRLIAEYL